MIELYDKNNVPIAVLTNRKIPLHDWCRLVILFTSNKVINDF